MISVVARIAQYIPTALATLRLRSMPEVPPAAFRMPWGPVVPVAADPDRAGARGLGRARGGGGVAGLRSLVPHAAVARGGVTVASVSVVPVR